MSDYCVCKDCGCKHLVWEKSCPYCRRIKELDKELDIASNEIHRLEAENAKLREAAQAVVDDAWGNGSGAYVISPIIFDALAAALEADYE